MKLIVVHRNGHPPLDNGEEANLQCPKKSNSHSLLRFAACTEPLSSIVFNGLNGSAHNRGNNEVIAIPQEWRNQAAATDPSTFYFNEYLRVPSNILSRLKANPWFIISNGRFVASIDDQLLSNILDQSKGQVIAMNVVPQLQAFQENILTTSQNKVVGVRRFFNDSVQPSSIPHDWPHYLFIKTDVVSKCLVDNAFPLVFSRFMETCFERSLTVRSLNVGGTAFDLGTEEGLLGFLKVKLSESAKNIHNSVNGYQNQSLSHDSVTISRSAKLFGKVLLGQNIDIGENVIIIGLAIIGSGVKIAKGAVIRSSVIAPGVSVPRNKIVQNRIIVDPQSLHKPYQQQNIYWGKRCSNFRTKNSETGSKFSYAGCFKRVVDVFAAIFVLFLFAPIIPIIVLVIKLTSPGPVFFKDKRQGLHGKAFSCLKFRSMLIDADKMQSKLRVLNQADGPQFMIKDDPRFSIVGRFLRETYIDEIPQFFNVLMGQMSIVGPRPSPESENTSCPPWRDLRLSVRPGITGLWQVCRTRQPMKDFQEWIHYDIKYVKKVSLKTDLWICWRTARKMAMNFINQF